MYQKIVLKKSVKLSVLIVSTCFILMNVSALRAQVTMMPDSGMTDTMTDMTSDTDTTTESTGTGNAGVPDPVTEPVEEEPSSSGGGGGGGAILGLLVVGAVVAVASSQKKKPTIQKTFAYEKDVTGRDVFLMDFSTKSPLSQEQNEKRLPELSLQLGSSSHAQPSSLMNLRLEKEFNTKMSLTSNIGMRSFQHHNESFKSWQWLNFGIQAKDLFAASDHLVVAANYTEGDEINSSAELYLRSNQFDQYKTLFLDRNTRFQLAYSKSLGENQRLGFRLSKDETNDRSDEHYRVQLVWQNAF